MTFKLLFTFAAFLVVIYHLAVLAFLFTERRLWRERDKEFDEKMAEVDRILDEETSKKMVPVVGPVHHSHVILKSSVLLNIVFALCSLLLVLGLLFATLTRV